MERPLTSVTYAESRSCVNSRWSWALVEPVGRSFAPVVLNSCFCGHCDCVTRNGCFHTTVDCPQRLKHYGAEYTSCSTLARSPPPGYLLFWWWYTFGGVRTRAKRANLGTGTLTLVLPNLGIGTLPLVLPNLGIGNLPPSPPELRYRYPTPQSSRT